MGFIQQVVVSAATGLFGMAKNVLDVWCNTTFLEEDGERRKSMIWEERNDRQTKKRVVSRKELK